MIPSDFENRCKMIEYMFKALHDCDDIKDYQRDMLDSFEEQYQKNKKYMKTLSDRQCEVLESIYDQYN